MREPAWEEESGAHEEDALLRALLEGTASSTGEGFFGALVRGLARVLETKGAWVTEYHRDARRLRALAFWFDGRFVPHYEYNLAGTPCEPVVDEVRLVHIPEGVVQLYPADPDLAPLGAVGYMGAPLQDAGGAVMGHLAVLHDRPLPPRSRAQAVLRVFAQRAAAELLRVRAEEEVRRREERLQDLIASAMDAILELDGASRVLSMNAAGEKLFGRQAAGVVGGSFADLLAPQARPVLEGLLRELEGQPGGPRSVWAPEGLQGLDSRGLPFPVEATLSRSAQGDRTTLILRDLREREEARRRLQALAGEADYLRQEVEDLQGSREILGNSPAVRRMLREIHEVAPTDATVLLSGETGTGKELVARALHASSRRRDRPLIRVNCAAMPANLVESELFGHERGAFTGATQRRQGRFELADGGTLFLDEIGELPLDLQAKLLRVLQEGEFEPVGSSRTRRVDVRVVAATNRDLAAEVKEGRFREDLYFRLNVYPIRVAPLRERAGDVPLLAAAFARRLARRMGRALAPLTAADVERLQAYAWPGNVRELHNVMERAVITARHGRLDLDRALPETPGGPAAASPPPPPAAEGPPAKGPILTRRALRELERKNILRALEACKGRIGGAQGAARLLGVAPSTLASRLKALGLRPGAPERP